MGHSKHGVDWIWPRGVFCGPLDYSKDIRREKGSTFLALLHFLYLQCSYIVTISFPLCQLCFIIWVGNCVHISKSKWILNELQLAVPLFLWLLFYIICLETVIKRTKYFLHAFFYDKRLYTSLNSMNVSKE